MDTKHLLIIEDDRDIRDILETILKLDGHHVTALNVTEDIIRTIEEVKPDLIITDYI